MLTTLQELNEMIVSISNYVVRNACEHTTSGQRFVTVSDALNNYQRENPACSYDDFLSVKDIILNTIAERAEVLDIDFDDYNQEFDVNCALSYCPSYEWCDGDEETFDCTYDEWLEMPVKPVVDQVSPSRYEEIAKQAIELINESVSVDKRYAVFHDDLHMNDNEIRLFCIEDIEHDADLRYSVQEAPSKLVSKPLFSLPETHKFFLELVQDFDGTYYANLTVGGKLVYDLPENVDYNTLRDAIRLKTGIEILKHKDMRFEQSGRKKYAYIDATQYREDCHVSLAEIKAGWLPDFGPNKSDAKEAKTRLDEKISVAQEKAGSGVSAPDKNELSK